MATSPAASGADAALVDSVQAMSRAILAVTARCLAQMDEEVTLAQYRALVMLVSRGPQRIGDLAVELGVAASTASRLCDRLANKGWIRRTQRAGDRRANWVELSRQGTDFVGAAIRLRRVAIRRLLDMSQIEGTAEIAAALNAFTAAAGEPAEARWWENWLTTRTRLFEDTAGSLTDQLTHRKGERR